MTRSATWLALLVLTTAARAEEPVVDPVAPEVDALGPDRSAPPPVAPAELMPLPEAEPHELDGIPVQLVRVAGVRKVHVRLMLRRGALDLAPLPTPATSATAWIQDTATADLKPEAFSIQEDLLDASVKGWIGFTSSGFELEVPREDLDQGIDLLRGVVHEPAFAGSELERAKQEYVRFWTIEAPTSAGRIAQTALTHAWFPADHPFGVRPAPAAWKKLKRRQLKEVRSGLLDQAAVDLLVIGDVSWDELRPLLEPVVRGLGAPTPEQPEPAYTPPAASRIVAIDLPGPQASLRLRLAAPLRDSPDRAAMEMVDFALGGAFLSRLNRNLREDKGLTYGCWTSLDLSRTRGHFTVGVDVKVGNVGLAMAEITRELDAIAADGVSSGELSDAWRDGVARLNRVQETADSVAGLFSPLQVYQETTDDVRAHLEALRKVDIAATRQAAAHWLGSDAPRLWVVVGEKEQLAPQLEKLGIDVVWLDPATAVSGQFD